MERIWHHNKPAKIGPPTKTHRPAKEDINQRGNKEIKDNPEGAELNFLAIKENAMSAANPTPLITSRTPSPQGSKVVAVSCCGEVFPSTGTGKLGRIEGLMDGAKYRTILEGNRFQSSEI